MRQFVKDTETQTKVKLQKTPFLSTKSVRKFMNQFKLDFKEFVQALFTWKYWWMLTALALGVFTDILLEDI